MKWTYLLLFVSFVLHPVFPLRQTHTPTAELAHLMVCSASVWWFGPRQQTGTHTATYSLAHPPPPPAAQGGKNRKNKSKKILMDENKDSLIHERKVKKKIPHQTTIL